MHRMREELKNQGLKEQDLGIHRQFSGATTGVTLLQPFSPGVTHLEIQ